LKGVTNNNYKLSGQLEQTNAKLYKGADKECSSISLAGNLQKKYCQEGNQELLNCDDDGTLSSKLLDQTALEVVEDPSEKVDEQVN
jgi:hypothetical protein